MKLQMMTHGDAHQYEDASGNFVAGYHSPEGSPYYQVPGSYTLQPYFEKIFTQTTPEPTSNSPITTAPPTATETSCSRVGDMMNEDLLREAEEQLRPLIKEELRHTIQCKRVAKGLPSHVEIEYKMPKSEPETPAMVMKRQRRRDRNKIAAAKCRMKKKVLSEKLIEESEQLEKQNQKLRIDVQRLQDERQRLIYILNLHRPTCIVRSPQSLSPHHNESNSPINSSRPASGPMSPDMHDFPSSPRHTYDDESAESPTPAFALPYVDGGENRSNSPTHRSVIVRSNSVQGS